MYISYYIKWRGKERKGGVKLFEEEINRGEGEDNWGTK